MDTIDLNTIETDGTITMHPYHGGGITYTEY